MVPNMNQLIGLGRNLRVARKQIFPNDNLSSFALRIGVSRATLQKMEKGDMSVSLQFYYRAASVLGMQEPFEKLFAREESLFDGQ